MVSKIFYDFMKSYVKNDVTHSSGIAYPLSALFQKLTILVCFTYNRADLNTTLVQYSNCQSVSNSQMYVFQMVIKNWSVNWIILVWYSNQDLNTGQKFQKDPKLDQMARFLKGPKNIFNY